jgi:vanillate O-demethylase ferredoxin subunit
LFAGFASNPPTSGRWSARFVSRQPDQIGQDDRGQREQTIVEALVAAGIEVATSCEQGVCGACLTTVLAGRPDHRDMLLTEEEQQAGDRILLCVSGCLDHELVLDL